MLFSIIFSSLDLGDGWFPAVLETEDEMDSIRVFQRAFSDDSSYLIGGEICYDPPAFINYTDYIPRLGSERRWLNGAACEFLFSSKLFLKKIFGEHFSILLGHWYCLYFW